MLVRIEGYVLKDSLERDEFENFDGSLYNITAVVEHDTFKNVGFGFGYSIFDFDLTAEDDEFRGEFAYSFQGPSAYINLMF